MLTAPQTLLVLLGLLALAVALGTLIPQIPTQAVDNPEAWLATQAGSFAQQDGLIRVLGLFDVYHAFWFRLLLVLMALTLFVWLVEAANIAWHGISLIRLVADKAAGTNGSPSASAPVASWGQRMARIQVPSPTSPHDTKARAEIYLSRQGYQWADVPYLSSTTLAAGRRVLTLWLTPVALTAFLVAVVILTIMGNWGWRSEEWQPAMGESISLGHGSPFQLRLDSFDLKLRDDGQIVETRSNVSWVEGTTTVRQRELGVGRPATLGGIMVLQVGYVPVVQLSGQDAAGRILTFQDGGDDASPSSAIEVPFSSVEDSPFVFVSSHDLFLNLAYEANCATAGPTLSITLLGDEGTGQQLSTTLHESGQVELNDLQLDVMMSYRPVLRADHQPAIPFLLGSIVTGIVALSASWLADPRLMWITPGPAQNLAASVLIMAPPTEKGSRWLLEVAEDLREVFSHDA